MGLKVTKAMQDLILKSLAADRERNPAKYTPIAGIIVGFLPGQPPTVTHHAKKIARRGDRLKLVDSPGLTAARTQYLSKIPENAGPPIAGPLMVRLEFSWAEKAATKLAYRQAKPDADNAAKVVLDLLCERGWIANDAQVSVLAAIKLNVPAAEAHKPGVTVLIQTITWEAYLTTFKTGLAFIPYTAASADAQAKQPPTKEAL
jgi:Holliday junction resolvase RusA-like endonuclease